MNSATPCRDASASRCGAGPLYQVAGSGERAPREFYPPALRARALSIAVEIILVLATILILGTVLE